MEIIDKLTELGESMGISVLDSVIVGGRGGGGGEEEEKIS